MRDNQFVLCHVLTVSGFCVYLHNLDYDISSTIAEFPFFKFALLYVVASIIHLFPLVRQRLTATSVGMCKECLEPYPMEVDGITAIPLSSVKSASIK